MKDRKRKYLKLLAMELVDLRDDIELLVTDCRERMEHEEISKYVFLENMAVFKNEVIGIDHVSALLAAIDPDAYTDLSQMIEDVAQRFYQRLDQYGFAEAPRRLIQRKLDKVAQYIHTE